MTHRPTWRLLGAATFLRINRPVGPMSDEDE